MLWRAVEFFTGFFDVFDVRDFGVCVPDVVVISVIDVRSGDGALEG
jgi:hypothetical protein